MPSRIPLLVSKLGLSVVALILTLAVLEGGLRIVEYLKGRQTLDKTVEGENTIAPGTKARLVDMIRREPGKRLIYSLKPNLKANFRGQNVETNQDGFHDRDYPVIKDPGVVRVVGIGDSIMFGWGVPSEANYLSVLERRLNERLPVSRWEVLNTAVPGYNTAMEVEALTEKGLKYDPDLVILGFCNNDFGLPNFLWQPQNHLRLDRSLLVDFVRERLDAKTEVSENEAVGHGLIRAPRLFAWRIPEMDLSEVPERYRDMIGWAGFETAIRELHRLSEEHGFEVLGVFYGVGNARPKVLAMDLMRNLDLHVVDMYEPLTQYMEASGIEIYNPSELTQPNRDPHPSVISHGLCAEALFDYIASGQTRLH